MLGLLSRAYGRSWHTLRLRSPVIVRQITRKSRQNRNKAPQYVENIETPKHSLTKPQIIQQISVTETITGGTVSDTQSPSTSRTDEPPSTEEEPFDIYSFVRERLAVETPPFGENLPQIAVGDIIEFTQRGALSKRTVTGFDGAKHVLAPPKPGSTPAKVPVSFILFRFPSSSPVSSLEPSPKSSLSSSSSSSFPTSEEGVKRNPETLVLDSINITTRTQKLLSTVENRVEEMWENLSKTHTQFLAQDAMKFLFGAPESLTPEQRNGAMFGEVPILHLYAAHSMLMANPIYFSMKNPGIFVCNSPELVEQLKQEDQALGDMALINSFIAAAQRKLWSDFGYTLNRQPSFKAFKQPKSFQKQEQVDQSANQPNKDKDTTTTLPTDVWDVHQYPILISALKRYAFSHRRMGFANTKVESLLLAPLGIGYGESGELVTMLERLGVYESDSNVHLIRTDFFGENLLAEFPAEIREAFDPKLLSQVPDLDKNRKNLRTLPVYTVDSASTVEIDDGLSLEYRGPEQTEWILIHIADPTRWIVPNGPLDLAARKRVSTLYLPEVVQAMLPLEIARDVMSIIPSQLSHALTFAVRLDEDGSVMEYEIFPSLIQNIKRTTFEYVDSVLNSDLLAEPVLHRLYEIALKRSAWRTQSGAYNIILPKNQVALDSDFNISMTFESASRAQLLVQEMMILTGQLSAAYATSFNIPVPYRSQQPPKVESEEYDQFLQTLPPIVKEFEYVSVAKRATVSTTPARHHGVGLDGYSRASSPIRRYHDMLVHHQIKAHIRGDPLPYSGEEMEKIVEETAARDALIHFLQKDSERFWKLKYVKQHKERIFTGLVLRASEYGVDALVMEVGLKCRLENKEELQEDGTMGINNNIKRGQVVPLEVEHVNQYSAMFRMLTPEEVKKKEEKQVEQ